MDILRQKRYKILLVGDNGTDVYRYGDVNRLSLEAPVPIFEPHYEIVREGMAGNVCKNLQALDCEVDFNFTEISIKERLIDKRSKHHLLRIDKDARCNPLPERFIEESKLKEYDAIVVSDYDKGTISYELVEWFRRSYIGPVFVDTKKTDLGRFDGCFVKINEFEHRNAKTLPGSASLITTYGERGAIYEDETVQTEIVPLIDVTGAGDTFLSALVYYYLTTQNIKDSIRFANKAASITVQHVGVYAPTLKEITCIDLKG